MPPFLTSPELSSLSGIAHGFFTRQGGVSEGIYGSLNCGHGSKDNAEHVRENRQRVARSLGKTIDDLDVIDDPIATLYQTHSTTVEVVCKSFERGGAPEADALVTNTPGVILGVLTADCGPILFADKHARVIATAHAGWKGAFNGIIENTVRAMEELGAKRNAIHAVLGPCIHQKSYEVSQDFVEIFLAQSKSNAAFFAEGKREGHAQFDLPGYIESRLHAERLGSIALINRDTCAEPDHFFSWRRTCLEGGSDYGRGISAIMLEG